MKWFIIRNQAETASSKEFEQRVHDSNLDLNESVHISRPRADKENGNKNEVRLNNTRF